MRFCGTIDTVDLEQAQGHTVLSKWVCVFVCVRSNKANPYLGRAHIYRALLRNLIRVILRDWTKPFHNEFKSRIPVRYCWFQGHTFVCEQVVGK